MEVSVGLTVSGFGYLGHPTIRNDNEAVWVREGFGGLGWGVVGRVLRYTEVVAHCRVSDFCD